MRLLQGRRRTLRSAECGVLCGVSVAPRGICRLAAADGPGVHGARVVRSRTGAKVGRFQNCVVFGRWGNWRSGPVADNVRKTVFHDADCVGHEQVG